MDCDNKGFTLIELIVVVVIIGILASIATPMMWNIKVKTICAEAVAGMATIRTALRQYYVEYNNYPPLPGIALYRYSDSTLSKYLPGLRFNDLTGTYFGKENYNVAAPDLIMCSTGVVDAVHAPTSAPRWAETQRIADDYSGGGFLRMRIDTGEITQSGISSSGYSS